MADGAYERRAGREAEIERLKRILREAAQARQSAGVKNGAEKA